MPFFNNIFNWKTNENKSKYFLGWYIFEAIKKNNWTYCTLNTLKLLNMYWFLYLFTYNINTNINYI